jgi:hypothetical protein
VTAYLSLLEFFPLAGSFRQRSFAVSANQPFQESNHVINILHSSIFSSGGQEHIVSFMLPDFFAGIFK